LNGCLGELERENHQRLETWKSEVEHVDGAMVVSINSEDICIEYQNLSDQRAPPHRQLELLAQWTQDQSSNNSRDGSMSSHEPMI
jgi:hypothetical protein